MNTDLEGPFAALVELLADRVAARLLPAPPADTAGGAGESGGSPWMNIATASGYLDWSRQRLYKLTAQGTIPHYKQEGRLLFHRQELDRWLAGFRQGSGDWINPENRAISR
jgi:excisionase family DNA binding protein